MKIMNLFAVTIFLLLSGACKKSNTINGSPTPAGELHSGFTFNLDQSDADSFTVIFNDTTKGATKWNWNFGDDGATDNTSNIKNPKHKYQQWNPGTIHMVTVTLTTANANSVAPTVTKNITVGKHIIPVITELKTIEDPVYHIVKDNNFHDLGTDMHFGYTAANDVFIEWDFGDGEKAYNIQTPVHTYKKTGNYTVTLKITSSSQDVAIKTMPVDVKVWDGFEINTITLLGTDTKKDNPYYLTIEHYRGYQFLKSKDINVNADGGSYTFDNNSPYVVYENLGKLPFALVQNTPTIPVPDSVVIYIYQSKPAIAFPKKAAYLTGINDLWNFALQKYAADYLMKNPETIITNGNPTNRTEFNIPFSFHLHHN